MRGGATAATSWMVFQRAPSGPGTVSPSLMMSPLSNKYSAVRYRNAATASGSSREKRSSTSGRRAADYFRIADKTSLDPSLNTPRRLGEKVDLGPHERYRLVGVGLSNFREAEQAAAQPPLFE